MFDSSKGISWKADSVFLIRLPYRIEFEYIKDKQAAGIWIRFPMKCTSFGMKRTHPLER